VSRRSKDLRDFFIEVEEVKGVKGVKEVIEVKGVKEVKPIVQAVAEAQIFNCNYYWLNFFNFYNFLTSETSKTVNSPFTSAHSIPVLSVRTPGRRGLRASGRAVAQ